MQSLRSAELLVRVTDHAVARARQRWKARGTHGDVAVVIKWAFRNSRVIDVHNHDEGAVLTLKLGEMRMRALVKADNSVLVLTCLVQRMMLKQKTAPLHRALERKGAHRGAKDRQKSEVSSERHF